VPHSVATAYWKSTEEAVPIMPRLSEGGALSSPKIVPTPPIFASLTLALLFDAFSMKIGSSPLYYSYI
jgi:hypothetical protein